MNSTDWVVIRTEFFNLQAEILRGLLEAQGIQVYLSSEGYQNAFGLDGPPHHQIEILVALEQKDRALALLAAYDANELTTDEEQSLDLGGSGEDPV